MHSPPRLRPPSPLNLQRLEKGAPLRTTTAASVTGTHVPPPHQNVKPTAMSLPRVPRPFAQAASACYVPFVRACIVVDSKPRNWIHNAPAPPLSFPLTSPGFHRCVLRQPAPLAHSPARACSPARLLACAHLCSITGVRGPCCWSVMLLAPLPPARPPSRPHARRPVRAPRNTHTHTYTHTHTHAAPPPRPTTRVTALNSCTLFYFRREKSPRHRRRSSGRGCSPSSSAPWPSAWASPPRRGPRAWL